MGKRPVVHLVAHAHYSRKTPAVSARYKEQPCPKKTGVDSSILSPAPLLFKSLLNFPSFHFTQTPRFLLFSQFRPIGCPYEPPLQGRSSKAPGQMTRCHNWNNARPALPPSSGWNLVNTPVTLEDYAARVDTAVGNSPSACSPGSTRCP